MICGIWLSLYDTYVAFRRLALFLCALHLDADLELVNCVTKHWSFTLPTLFFTMPLLPSGQFLSAPS